MKAVEVAARPSAAAEVRRWLAAELPGMLRAGAHHDALLLASDVVSERVLSSSSESTGPIRVEVEGDDARVTVSVSGGGIPFGHADPMTTRLAARLLDRLSSGWGADASTVWFRLDPGPLDDPTRWSDEDLFEARDRLPATRHELFDRYHGLAAGLARRMASGGDAEDLVQVASIGLIKAIDRFAPDMGAAFSTYASRTIEGEMKRYFRDTSWSMRVPRGLKESALLVARRRAELEQELGRSPTVEDIAAGVGLEVDEVIEALRAGDAHTALSIDAPAGDDESPSLAEVLGDSDGRLSRAEAWAAVVPALEHLPERERRIMVLRFFEDMTQSSIAEVMGMSQMHVSRLLRKALDDIRRRLT